MITMSGRFAEDIRAKRATSFGGGPGIVASRQNARTAKSGLINIKQQANKPTFARKASGEALVDTARSYAVSLKLF